MTARAQFRSRLARAGALLPFAAAALVATALAVPACGGGSTTTSNTGGSSGGGTGGSSDCPTACEGDTPVCDVDNKTCVGCLPADDTCGTDQYCEPLTNTCEAGCKDDKDCTSPTVCDPESHQCVGCTQDNQCNPGFICAPGGSCVEGCNADQLCASGFTCCTDTCVDIANDPKQCGSCGTPCPNLPNAAEACLMGVCYLGQCDQNYADCNGDQADGCEWDVGLYGPCTCMPGEVKSCYSGPVGTEDVGLCKGGMTTCDATGTVWGPCEGEVLPGAESGNNGANCSDGVDNDCDGTADNDKDLDGDGWTKCNGDCCDVAIMDDCGDPNLVNPGAFEVDGNMVDDDCDKTVDNVLGDCDAGLASNSATATDYAKAIDLCATTTENPALKDKKWGVISGSFFRANGQGTPDSGQRSIRGQFGDNLPALAGSKLAVLSTGVAAAQNAPSNTNPNFVKFQGGKSVGITSGVPSDWLQANNNNFPNAPNCPEPQGGTTANDPIMLKLRVRVPTNAKSFDVNTYFFSSEYPEWVCSAFNDFFLALIDSTVPAGNGMGNNPADKNLAFYQSGNKTYPVGVNLATGNTGLFSQCQTSATGCGSGAVAGNNTCQSTTQLVGTGFDDPNPPAQFPGDPAYCTNGKTFAGGGTGWLTTTGNVKPGETIELRFVIWDTGDGWYDSVALIDNFVWSLDASTPGTHQ